MIYQWRNPPSFFLQMNQPSFVCLQRYFIHKMQCKLFRVLFIYLLTSELAVFGFLFSNLLENHKTFQTSTANNAVFSKQLETGLGYHLQIHQPSECVLCERINH